MPGAFSEILLSHEYFPWQNNNGIEKIIICSFQTPAPIEVKYADVMCSFFVAQMKEWEEKLPPEVSDSDTFKELRTQAADFINTSIGRSSLELEQQYAADKTSLDFESSKMEDNKGEDPGEAEPQNSSESHSRSPESSTMRSGQKEVIEQFEPGVYVTLLQLQNGARVFRRVKFR